MHFVEPSKTLGEELPGVAEDLRGLLDLIEARSPRQAIADYLEAFFRLGPGCELSQILRGPLLRRVFTHGYGFAVPTAELLDEIQAHGRVLEVGAGTGFLASLCPNIRATDNKSTRARWFGDDVYEHAPIENLRAGLAFEKYVDSSDAILLSWPPLIHSRNMCAMSKVLATLAFRNLDKTVLYIGEAAGGCTAGSKFHRILDEDFTLEKSLRLSLWEGIHDRLFIYRRKHAPQD